MKEDSPAQVPRKSRSSQANISVLSRGRSRDTNRLAIDGTDGRSSRNRRFRDIALGLADGVGGWDGMSEPSRVLVRQSATLAIQIADLQAKMIATEPTVGQGEVLSRLVNLQRRTMTELRAVAPVKKQTTIHDYIREKYGND